MIEVKRYVNAGLGYATESDAGEYVKYEDYAELKVQSHALAAKAQELCSEAAQVYQKYNATQMPDMDLVDCQTIQELSDLAGDPSATDAYLNSLRAEGVEMFAKHQNSMVGIPNKSDAALRYAARAAIRFAAQLRAGKDGE